MANGSPPPPVPWTPPSPGTPAPAPHASLGRWLTVGIAAAVVVALAIAGLYAGGIGPFHRPTSSGPPPSAVTFREAVALANQSAAAYGAGPWQVGAAGGVDLTASDVVNATIVPLNTFSAAGVSCPGEMAGGAPTELTVSPYAGALASGAAPSWILLEFGGGTALVIWVHGGTSTVLEEFTGGECGLVTGLLAGIPPSAVDSPVAASAALGDGGSAFILAHPGGSLVYVATSLAGPASWSVTYTTCPASGTPVSGTTYYAFTADVSWITGTVVGTPVAGPIANCSSLFSLSASPGNGGGSGGTALSTALGLAASATSVTGGYAVSVTRAAAGLVMSDLEVTLENATTHAAVSGTWEVELDASSGCGLAAGAFSAAYYISPPIGACSSGTLGNGALLSAGETIGVYSLSPPSSVAGLELVVSGAAGYTGELSVPLS